MRMKWKLAVCALCALGLGTVAYAAGGAEDPLVTLSYLTNVFTGQVKTMVDDAVGEQQTQFRDELNQSVQNWDEKVNQAIADLPLDTEEPEPEPGEVANPVFVTATVSAGQTLVGQTGCEIILRSGQAVLTAGAGGGMVDQTDGTLWSAGKALQFNHLYMMTGECSLTVAPLPQTGTVNAGPLNVRSGPGSSHKVQSQLAEGTVVTITGEAQNGWYPITTGSVSGYVSATYVDLNAPATPNPVTVLVRGPYTIG